LFKRPATRGSDTWRDELSVPSLRCDRPRGYVCVILAHEGGVYLSGHYPGGDNAPPLRRKSVGTWPARAVTGWLQSYAYAPGWMAWISVNGGGGGRGVGGRVGAIYWRETLRGCSTNRTIEWGWKCPATRVQRLAVSSIWSAPLCVCAPVSPPTATTVSDVSRYVTLRRQCECLVTRRTRTRKFV